MAMASLDASLLARKGTARPVVPVPAAPTGSARTAHENTVTVHTLRPARPPENRTTKTPAPAMRHKKHVRLNDRANRNLRILAASLGTSQQVLMAEAIDTYLEMVAKTHGCLCQAAKE